MTQQERDQLWPALPFADWKDTCVTLHMWTQIVGKVRLALTPWLNHSWHVTLYVTARGLTTSPIAHHMNVFEIDFDFMNSRLLRMFLHESSLPRMLSGQPARLEPCAPRTALMRHRRKEAFSESN